MPFVDHLFAVYWNGDTYFYHKNNLRSTTVTTNHSGAWVDEAVFSPWGVPLASIENFADLLDYDSKTDNDIVAFRIYSPSQGRWVSPDSLRGDVTNPQSLNLYPYVTDNPTTLTDPSGLCGCGGGDFGFGEGGGGWGGGCGGGFGGGFGGRRGGGPPPPPPIIPLPGPITTSIAGGGLFSDPFSFASVEGAPPPLVDIVYSLPLDPTPSDTGKCHGTVSNFAPAGAFDLCQDQGMYLMEAWSCDQGGSKLCCEAKQIQFEDCCSGYGWTPIPLNNGRSFLAECCSKTKRTLPPPGGKAPYCAGG
jgi:RHS repeat-associated protein